MDKSKFIFHDSYMNVDGGREEYTDQKGREISIDITQDPYANSPLVEDDCLGKIFSFGRKHGNFLPMEATNIEDACVELDKRFGKNRWNFLSYYQHDGCMWFPTGSPAPAGVEFQWDGRRIAGVWVADYQHWEKIRRWKPLKRSDEISKTAALACKLYTAWCNGEVYNIEMEIGNQSTNMQAYGVEEAVQQINDFLEEEGVTVLL